jgi:tetratricopeptide (TPR) repeat protein
MHYPAVTALLLVYLGLALSGCNRTPGEADVGVIDEAAVAVNNRGVGLMGRYDYEAALQLFEQLDGQHPGIPEFRFNLAVALMNRQLEGDEVNALSMFTDLAARHPDDVRITYCAGLLEYRRGELATAAGLFERVLQVDPADAYAAYFLGQSLQQQGDYSGALAWYERVIETDPYLRSAYYAAAQLYRSDGRPESARDNMALYQRLANNPRAQLVDFLYTRMGPKCEAVTVGSPAAAQAAMPEGQLFGEAQQLLSLDAATPRQDARRANLTTADINGDGHPDLFIAGAGTGGGDVNALLLGDDRGGFTPLAGHPLSRVPDVNAALWGDYDNDGLLDVYLLRQGENRLWRQAAANDWQDVTLSSGTGNGDADSRDGALFDADHDGDLDILLVNRDAPNELLNNNLDGSFRAIASEQGLDGGDRDTRSLLLLDIDNDRDTDIIVLNASPPHEVYLNDLMWRYRPADGLDAFLQSSVRAAVAGDTDGDGLPELYTLDDAGVLLQWREDGNGAWDSRALRTLAAGTDPQLELRDFDGDGQSELRVATATGWTVLALRDGAAEPVFTSAADSSGPAGFGLSLLPDIGRGPALAVVDPANALWLWPPGEGRQPFIGLALTGLDEQAESMRSNASGIGTQLAVRSGSRWILTDTFRHHSSPGQSLQPVAVGLGGAGQADFVAVTWSDGVYQTELGLETGQLHHIRETQRQLSSCPVLFAWDGERYVFVSDLLGVGGMGYFVKPGVYAPPRPWENFLLPAGLPQARDGRYRLKIGEPMEEAAYLDSMHLAAWDLPPGWDVVLDERMAILGPDPTGAALFYRDELLPRHATDRHGRDVTASVTVADLQAPPVGELDRRFIGRLQAPQVLTLEFDAPLDTSASSPVLVIDGWVEYPYSQTMFAAWQAAADYQAPTLQARGADGQWHTLLEQFGYPAGMPRRMSVALTGLPQGTNALRLSTNQEIYWDRVAVVYSEPLPAAVRHELPLQDAEVKATGFAQRTTGPQRQPHYDYGRRSPFWDTRHMRGHYTAFGPSTELLVETDDALAIIGPGEEVHLEFSDNLPQLPPGWRRRFVLESRGWTKDMDLYTEHGETLEPLPDSGRPAARREALHARYNRRYRSGI